MNKWVRVYFGDETVADSRRVQLLRGAGHIPVYYFPQEDVQMALLAPAGEDAAVAGLGDGPWPEPPDASTVYSVEAGERSARRAAWLVEEAPGDLPELAGHVAFIWDAMDAWYEEDQRVHVHAHDPRLRIDIRPSSRHVRVVVGGETVAETHRPVLLFETGLPVRYYIPRQDVRRDLLVPSDRVTRCPYKGTASYYSVEADDRLHEALVWYYPLLNDGFALIQDLLAFYQERVDAFYVDGEQLA
jgi:uncharacterized protein (DUF427 family)